MHIDATQVAASQEVLIASVAELHAIYKTTSVSLDNALKRKFRELAQENENKMQTIEQSFLDMVLLARRLFGLIFYRSKKSK